MSEAVTAETTTKDEPKVATSKSSTPKVTVADLGDRPVVLFDGVCNFCNGAIQFMVDHEREPKLSFAPLQSDLAKELLDKVFGDKRSNELRNGLTGSGDPDTIVLVEGDKGYTHSTAGLRIARYFRAPWRWGYASIIFPRFLRDVVYRFIAKNRYRWFGRSETCRIPTPELRKRFLA
jgi:predicted DCC family thiol-disulfide oxidoreductase YuxK